MAEEKLADPATVNNLIKAACILYTFVLIREGVENRTQDYAIKETVVDVPSDIKIRNLVINEGSSPNTLRNYLANHFLSPRASRP